VTIAEAGLGAGDQAAAMAVFTGLAALGVGDAVGRLF
jgi:hypothetical protein